MADSSLAEVFLGFGGRTSQILGTVFTGVAVLYSINKSTGHGIKLLQTLPYWLGLKKDVQENEEALTRKQVGMQLSPYALTRRQVGDELSAYSKLIALVIAGIGLKKLGGWAVAPSTTEMFNSFLYKSS